jgi:hypothetical protein
MTDEVMYVNEKQKGILATIKLVRRRHDSLFAFGFCSG